MKAAVVDAFGPSPNVVVRDIPRPRITAEQILLEVHASSVNPIDWKIAEGMMRERYGAEFPMTLGFDASGVVAEVGASVAGFRPGDEVFARSDIGPGKCYAEYVAINPGTAAVKPSKLSHNEAAAMPLAALTALNGLRGVGELAAGQRVLINGASGGVGVYAVQIARNMGARVTGVCSAANMALVGELGADELIDYNTRDPLAADRLYDVIYDTVGTLKPETAKGRLTDNGVYLTLVPVPGIDFFLPGQTQRQARGGYFLVWTPKAADLKLLADWVEQGQLRSVIDSVYPLERIREAHQRSRTLRARGKIVIRVKGGADLP